MFFKVLTIVNNYLNMHVIIVFIR